MFVKNNHCQLYSILMITSHTAFYIILYGDNNSRISAMNTIFRVGLFIAVSSFHIDDVGNCLTLN